jgi:hypothetical protein
MRARRAKAFATLELRVTTPIEDMSLWDLVDQHLDEELQQTFPASDPTVITQPHERPGVPRRRTPYGSTRAPEAATIFDISSKSVRK